MKKKFKLLLKLAVSLILLFWIVFKVDWEEVVFYLSSVSYGYLFLYALAIVAGVSISAYKWKMLAGSRGMGAGYFDFFKFYVAGTFINNFMPSFLGGDAYRIYRLGEGEKKYAQAGSSVLLDRLTGFVSVNALVIFFGILNFARILESKILLLAFILNILLFLLFVSLFVFRIKNFPWAGKIMAFIPKKALSFMEEVSEYKKDPKTIWRAVGWGMVFNLLGVGVANFILFMAMGIEISLINFFSVIFIISIVSAIPVSINNIGVKEWAYAVFFGAFGLNFSAVITAAMLGRIIQMLLSFAALPVYLQGRK